jgi:hypothetical protein
MSDYRQMAVDHVGEEWVQEAEAAGVPVPFWEVSYKIRSSNGRYGEIRIQFDTQDEATAFAGQPRGPGETQDSPAISAVLEAIGGVPVAIDGGLSVCWDPREWDGGPVTRS